MPNLANQSILEVPFGRPQLQVYQGPFSRMGLVNIGASIVWLGQEAAIIGQGIRIRPNAARLWIPSPGDGVRLFVVSQEGGGRLELSIIT